MQTAVTELPDRLTLVKKQNYEIAKPLIDRLELYADKGCPFLWLLDEVRLECWMPSGVEGYCEMATRLARALKRVGALICDFLGVTVADLLRLDILELEERNPWDGVDGT